MKLELKAYKCAFPELYTGHYDENWHLNDKDFMVIYGKNQRDAVKKTCTENECETFWTMKRYIRTRRFKEADLFSQEKHNSLIDLSEKEIGHLTHSLGVRIGDCCPKEFYRNYSAYSETHERCEKLVLLGLMENYQKMNSQVYSVTEKGIEAVKTLLLTPKGLL